MKEDKFKSIDNYKPEIVRDFFVLKKTNISELSRKYGPYSTVRRFILDEKKRRDEEDIGDEEYFNTADFPFLDIDYTYQWTETTRIWRVDRVAFKESEEVWVLVPSKSKGKKHFICTEEEVV